MQAAGHPKLTVSIDPNAQNADTTGGDDLKDIAIDAPAGLQLNMAAATSKCTDSQLSGGTCPGASKVGTLSVKFRSPVGSTITYTGNGNVMTTPTAGNTASIGFLLKTNGYKNLILRANVSNAIPVAQPTRITVINLTRTLTTSLGITINATIDQIDAVINARANASANGPYFTLNPSSCGVNTTQATLTPYSNTNPVVTKSSSYTTTGCPAVLFQPTATVAPTVSNLNAPTGLNTSFTVPSGELTTQQSSVKKITVATPNGVFLSQPNISAVIPCSEANLLADTCPLASKIGTTSFTFWGATAAAGDLYKGASISGGFEIAAVSRGANGVIAISRGRVVETDTNNDLIVDNVQLVLDSLPNATWSAASVNITSTLLRNSCPTGNSNTTIQGASAATVVRSATWLIGICQPTPETTITGGPSGFTNNTAPQFTFSSSLASSTFACQMDSSAFAPCTSPTASPTLTQGPHMFCVRATSNGMTDQSPACRSFTVDTIAPTVNITSVGNTVTFATEAGATTTCRLNSNPAVACTSPWFISIPDDASYTITVCATDPAGNVGCSSRFVDPVPPDTSITSGPSGYVASSNATFAFTATEPNVLFACSLDGAPATTCSSPVSLTALSQGSHTFCVYATDAAGNVDPTPACRTFIVDTISPAVVFTSPTGPITGTSLTITWVVSDASPITLQTCRIDGGAAYACTSPQNLTGLSYGSHTFTVCATDAATNVGCGTISWTVPPPSFTVTITSGPPSLSTNRNPVFTFIASISPVTFECSLNGVAYSACTSPRAYTNLNDGSHTFCVRARDSIGNLSTNTACQTFTVSVEPPPPPVLIRTSPLTSPSNQTTASFTVNWSEPGGTLQGSLDGGAYSSITSPINFTGLSNGAHLFSVRGVDATGGVSSAVTNTWVVDTVAPAALTATLGPIGASTASVNYSGVEAGATVQGSLDGAAYATAPASPVNFSGLSNGAHAYALRQVDAAGNISSVTTVVWMMPGPIGQATITGGPSGTVSSTSATFTFTSTVAGWTFQCQLDNSAWTTCTSPLNYTALAQGNHTFCVRAVSPVGDLSTAACRSWTVDTIGPLAPTVTLVSPTTSPTNQTTAIISWVGAEAGGSFQRSIDGGAFATTSSPLNLSNLANGCHTVSVRQVDLAGNIGSASSVAWCVGGVPPISPPTLTRTSPTSSPASQSTASFDVSGEAAGTTIQGSLDGATFAAMTSPINLTGLADGTHTFTVRLIDAGGTTSPSVSDSWVVDTIAPAAPPMALSSPVASPTTQTSASVFIGMSESGVTLQGSLDGAPYATVSNYVNLTGLALGTHTYSARQIDPAGNISSVATIVWTIVAPTSDTVAPSISGLSSSLGAGGATITYSASDDSGATPTCTPASGTTFPFHSTATLLVTVSCLDGTGNMNTTSLNVSSNGPAMGLVTTLTGGPSGNTTSPAPTFTYSVNRPTSGTLPCTSGQTCAAVTVPLIEFNCTLDGSAVSCGEGSYTPPTLPLGVHTFCAGSRGIYSGEASAPACRTFTVIDPGSTPPDVTVTSPPFYGATGASPMNVAYKVNGSTTIPAGTTCSVDGVPSTSPTTNAAVLDLGTNAIPVTCANASGSDTEYVVMARYAGYGVAITTPAPNSTHSSASVNVTYNQWSYGSSGTCTINGIASGSGSTNNVALPLGTSNIDLVCPWGNSVTKSSISVTRGDAPTVAITAPANNSFAGSSTNVSYTVDGFVSPPAGTTCRVNGVLSTGGTTNMVALASGANLITVSCSNAYGYNTATVTVNNGPDITPPAAPTVTLVSPSTFPTNQTSATISWVGAEAGGSFQTSLNGSAYATSVSPVNLIGLSATCHTFSVRQVDVAGNVGSAASVSWCVGGGPPPPTPTVSGPTGLVASTSATFTFTAVEAGLTYECQLDGGPWTVCTSPRLLTALAQGTHTFCVRARNSSGDVGSPACLTWTVDTVAPPIPTLTRVSPATSPTTSTTAQFAFTDTEAGVIFQASFDGGAYAAAVSPVNLTGLSSGTHAYAVRAVDAAGNQSPTATNTWTIQSVPPPLQIIGGPSGYVASTSASFNFTGAQPGDVYECQLDALPWTTCVPPFNVSALGQGFHSFCVRITNAGGTSTPVCRTWRVDTIVPQISFTGFPPNDGSTSLNFSWTITDASPIVSVTCQLDGGSPVSCNSPWVLSSIAMGSHTLTVCATDAAGNVGCANVSWTRISPPGAPIIVGGPNGAAPTASATFSFVTGNPSGTGYECRLDGGAWTVCTSPRSYTGLANGAHQFCVRATNAAGPGAEACRVWTVDTIPPPAPSVTLATPSSSPTTQTNATIIFSSTEVGVNFQTSLDGGAYQPATSPAQLTGLSQGVHVFSVRSIDAAGNIGSATSVTWTIAAAVPTVTITSPTSGSTTTASVATLNFTTSGFSGTPTCDRVSGSQVALKLGSNTFSVLCQDASSGASATTTVTRQAIGSFSPTFSQSFPADPSSRNTGLVISLNNPAGSDPIKSALINEPSALDFNYPAIGSSAERCPGSSLVITPTSVSFFTDNCPPQAKVGTVTLSSPDFSGDLHGNVFQINRFPGAWFGIDFSDPALGNPTVAGALPTMAITTDKAQIDPSCDVEIDYCPTYIRLNVLGFPDVAALNTTISIDGPDRQGSFEPLSGKLFQWVNESCDTVSASASVTPVSGAATVLNTPMFLPPCD
ncbi:MAG: hypothetical protein ACRDKE_09540 [Solirubrobacterales bacterium]